MDGIIQGMDEIDRGNGLGLFFIPVWITRLFERVGSLP
jgi:hypothetical protein